MTQPDELEEEPLDPATERIRRKMVRLLAVSISIMMVGLLAVLGAIVYRLSEPDTISENGTAGVQTPAILPEGRIDLDDGATIESVALDGNRILLQVRTVAGRELLLYSLENGQVLARVAVD